MEPEDVHLRGISWGRDRKERHKRTGSNRIRGMRSGVEWSRVERREQLQIEWMAESISMVKMRKTMHTVGTVGEGDSDRVSGTVCRLIS
jgi:hypothetical protein